jgi:hypothetical protein
VKSSSAARSETDAQEKFISFFKVGVLNRVMSGRDAASLETGAGATRPRNINRAYSAKMHPILWPVCCHGLAQAAFNPHTSTALAAYCKSPYPQRSAPTTIGPREVLHAEHCRYCTRDFWHQSIVLLTLCAFIVGVMV